MKLSEREKKSNNTRTSTKISQDLAAQTKSKQNKPMRNYSNK